MVVLKADGTVWAWGDNSFGQLGLGEADRVSSDVPRQITALNGKNVVMVYAGANHSGALTSDGRVYMWGSNSNGQLGASSLSSAASTGTPTLLTTLPAASKLLLGNTSSAALTTDGRVFTWGSDTYGQRGNDVTSALPNQAKGLARVIDISAGVSDTVRAVRYDGSIWTWGASEEGNKTANGVKYFDVPTKTAVLNDERTGYAGRAVAIYDSNSAHYILLSDGSVVTWGRNDKGQLGRTTENDVDNVPFRADQPDGLRVVGLSVGADHAATLLSNMTVAAWGSAEDGRIGQGTRTVNETVEGEGGETTTVQKTVMVAVDEPTVVPDTGDIHYIAAGGAFTVLMRADGQLMSFGKGDKGQLGNGDEEGRAKPDYVAATALTIHPEFITIPINITKQFTLDYERFSVMSGEAAEPAFVWTIEEQKDADGEAAELATIDATGKVVTGAKEGTLIVRVTEKDLGMTTAVAEVEITEVRPEILRVTSGDKQTEAEGARAADAMLNGWLKSTEFTVQENGAVKLNDLKGVYSVTSRTRRARSGSRAMSPPTPSL